MQQAGLIKASAKKIVTNIGLMPYWRAYNNQKRKDLQLKLLKPYLRQGKNWLENYSIADMHSLAIAYFNKLRVTGDSYGPFRYSLSQNEPILYASAYAACLMSLYGDINKLSDIQKIEWINYLQSFQSANGMFMDTAIDCSEAYLLPWWGWNHLTLHVLMALKCLDAVAKKDLVFLEPYYSEKILVNWLETREWDKDPVSVSNEIQNMGVFFQYSRDFHNEKRAQHSLNVMFDWLDNNQDPETGSWGQYKDKDRKFTDIVQTGYHIWELYFYDHHPINYIENIIDAALTTQNKCGGFGISYNSSGCEDIDSIVPLVRLSQITAYRKEDIIKSLRLALPWVLGNYNDDGSAVFKRLTGTQFIHPNMAECQDEGSAYATWWRTLSLAYLGKVIQDSKLIKYSWNFVKCPGHQFWVEK